ncbi:N-6 DNA methylase [Cryobacterium sp. 10I1]|nr:type ISP restriction/modification enzyme [Cryobacterium sp. 10I1]MEB0306258.1 N-6 DNA methylase [Cryobacterium sp. 10I1]
MVNALEGTRLDTETEELDAFYASVRKSVNGITDAAGKQTTIKRLYEKFFAGAFKGTSERLGIVYTPNEIVDFILHSADEVLRTEFGATLSDEGVHILDPFTGTGTFIVRLLQSGLIKPEDLQRKFRHELHANEIVLLAYYVAAVNIEATYHGLIPAGQDTTYEPFPGIVLTDTFQSSEDDDRYDDRGIFGDNNDRAKAQNALDIRVIVGNPPYSAGQDSGNENNQNLKYPFLDARIAATYAALSTAQNKNSLYDSYIRSIRWASDRLKDRGVVAFVSNGGFIDGNTADGLRKTLTAEFSSLYIFNLRGNQRTSGEQSRREGGKVFGEGSRATIAISILVKNPKSSTNGQLHYRDIGDYLSREDKLAMIKRYGTMSDVPWTTLTPNAAGDWLNQRNDVFASFTPIGDKTKGANPIFATYSRGLETGRDAWVYNSSEAALTSNVAKTVEAYNDEVDRWEEAGKPLPVEDFIDRDPTRISWARSLRNALGRSTRLTEEESNFTVAMYRPFNKQNVYFASMLNHERSQIPRMFPTSGHENFGLYLTGLGAQKPFAVLAVGSIPDLNLWGSEGGQFFPRYTYESRPAQAALFGDEDDFMRVDNINDEILTDYRHRYGANVSKDDVFFFVYGLLHSSDYRATYASDLKKMLPRIPILAEPEDFIAFSEAGRHLSELHLGYESVEPYPLTITRLTAADPDYRVSKMRFGGKAGAWDKTTIRYNDSTAITGIPPEAQEYLLGSRSAIEWIIERYQVKVDGPSGIRNDPNDWVSERDNPTYILTLLQRIVTISLETARIVNELPPLRIAQQ